MSSGISLTKSSLKSNTVDFSSLNLSNWPKNVDVTLISFYIELVIPSLLT